MRGFVGKVVWAFFVASVAFAIIGDPTVGVDQFKSNLVSKADGFKGLVDDLSRDLREGDFEGTGTGGAAPNGGKPGTGAPGGTAKPGDQPVSTPAKDAKALNALKVVRSQSGAGYDRDDWTHWIDLRPCWSVRDEVLLRDAEKGSAVLVDSKGRRTDDIKKACGLAAGEWKDPYSKLVFTKPSDVDIDHVVPLENAHRSGGADWSKARKREYANYLDNPNHLRAVAAAANRSKGAQAPSTWVPIDRSKHCWYARSWVRIKTEWSLTITGAEKQALKDMLSTCSR